MLDRAYQALTSLRLTVVLLALATVIVFAGTIAQVDQGLYQAQARYFRSLLIYWSPAGSSLKLPIFPGGYLVGGLMLLNLLAITIRRMKPLRDHLGLWMVHAGMILLLLGQLFTDLLSVESAMRLNLGETKQYSEDFHANELVVIDASDPREDRVVSLPESRVAQGGTLDVPGTPLRLRVKQYWANAEILDQTTANALPTGADQGVGLGRFVLARPPTPRMEERNVPAAILELTAGPAPLGTWLASSLVGVPQEFSHDGKTYRLAMRPKRHYTTHSLTLLDLKHDVYKGTDIPKDFRSRVRIQNPKTGEDREAVIYMNNPLRYGGATYYQYQMAASGPVKSSTLQVVRNPSWLTPYLSCLLVGLGLTVQFLSHLVKFVREKAT